MKQTAEEKVLEDLTRILTNLIAVYTTDFGKIAADLIKLNERIDSIEYRLNKLLE